MRVHGLWLVFLLCNCAWTSSTWVPPTDPPSTATNVASVLVTPQESVGRECIVLNVLDFHADADSEDKGFEALRAKAAGLGADAVLSAEFEHGEDGELSHLSGVAVRYSPLDKRPFDVIGPIDVATPEDAEDKGFEELKRRAREMGADEVRNIEFEHGEEGGQSHLRGVAVLHRTR